MTICSPRWSRASLDVDAEGVDGTRLGEVDPVDKSWMRSVRPSSVQVLKYQYTVSHGGKSCGSWRHEQPVRFRYKIASTIRRRGWVAGRPPGRGSTIGAISSHCASVRSDGYDSGSHAHIGHAHKLIERWVQLARLLVCLWRWSGS